MRYRMDRALRHLLLLAFISLFPLGLWAEGKVYTPELVPNVFTTDSTRLLSDPEGYISAEGRERIDAALYEIRRTTGVEFATVILPSIGERDIESFSTDLFRLWGLGSKTRNDGLLLLVVMDKRKVRFETGYGMEGILTDVRASRIQRQYIIPLMREGDYDGAIYNGVVAVGKVLQGEEYTSDRRTARGEGESFTFMLWLLYGVLVFSAGYSAFSSLYEEKLRSRTPHLARERLPLIEARAKTHPILLYIICLPVGLLYHFYARRVLNEIRHLASSCPQCRQDKMAPLASAEGWRYLTPAEQKEMEIGSRLYSVYQCSHCHYAETAGRDISDAWTRCEHCGARTVALERTELIDGGRYERRHYCCRNCGHDSHSDHRRQSDNDELLRGMLLGALLNSGRNRGGWGGGGFGGGGFGGGSFGGGSSGGGGATGGW